MRGWVSAEPNAWGCGVKASAPWGWTRRPSFSMPRRIPARRWAVGISKLGAVTVMRYKERVANRGAKLPRRAQGWRQQGLAIYPRKARTSVWKSLNNLNKNNLTYCFYLK